MRLKAVLVIYLVISVVHLITGITYVTANQFMSYHAQAVGTTWAELDSGVQTLILALMTVAGGGWLTLCFFTVVLAWSAFRAGSVAVRWALPIGTIIFYLGSFIATWGVYQQTGASTPWGPSLLMIGIALFALFLDAPWSFKKRADRYSLSGAD